MNVPTIPLPAMTRELVVRNLHDANPGLVLDKYVESLSAKRVSGADPDEGGGWTKVVQRPALDRLVKATQSSELSSAFSSARVAWTEMTDHLISRHGGVRLQCKGVSPLAIHLSRASVLENAGLCLHPVYGFVCLAGAGLKGLARAYACEVWFQDEPQQASAASRQAAFDLMCRVFGYGPSPWLKAMTARYGVTIPRSRPAPADECQDAHSADEEEPTARAGEIVFYDAWPAEVPRVAVDIVNCHHQSYYAEGKSPGDWENPVPVCFPVVEPGCTFDFVMTCRRMCGGVASGTARSGTTPNPAAAGPCNLLTLASGWLIGGLTELGCGAKTASGYGRFVLSPSSPDPRGASRRSTTPITLRLESPAFLGDADGGVSEFPRCPSIKGVLRQWFRAWNGRLTPAELRKREADLFGSTATGVGISVSADPVSPQLRPLRKGAEMGGGGSALGYMGYGPVQYSKETGTNRTCRPAVDAGQEFVLRLHHTANGDDLNRTIWLFGALGGLGARSRRAWGSVTWLRGDLACPNLPNLAACTSRDAYLQGLHDGLAFLCPHADRPSAANIGWTAISRETRLVLSGPGFQTWRQALEALGDLFMAYRNRDCRGGEQVGPDYSPTKDLLHQNVAASSVPQRAAFGLPYAIAYPSLKRPMASVKAPAATYTPEWSVGDRTVSGRRASPIICKIVRLNRPDRPFHWQVAFLPSQFLPQGATVRVERTDIVRAGVAPTSLQKGIPAPGALGVARPGSTSTLLIDFMDWLESEQIRSGSRHVQGRSGGHDAPRAGGSGAQASGGTSKRPRRTPVSLRITGPQETNKKGNVYWPVIETADPSKEGKLFGRPPDGTTLEPGAIVQAAVLDDNPGNRQYDWPKT
ncbi:MAG: type III-B CRISPR module RAMP protein Cmr6 [Phycisphaerales bacterium]|nr:type III-B CRISPR module RAMP protein Cmr6 [Phycisphaerales bacterium]